MNRTARLVTVVSVAAMLLSTAGCNKLKARDQLNKGVQSFRGAKYEEAIEHFKNQYERVMPSDSTTKTAT